MKMAVGQLTALLVVVLSSNSIVNGHSDNVLDKVLERIDTLEEYGKVQQDLIVQQQDQLRHQETRLQQLERDTNNHNEKNMKSPSTRFLLYGTEGPVAFHAVLEGATHSHIGSSQVIVFPSVRLNTGNAYHPNTGLFIAPQNGLYLFSASITSGAEAHVNILKNNTELAGAYSKVSSVDQGSVTLVTELKRGDEITVTLRRPDDTSIYGDHLSSFMGCLLLLL